MCSFSIFAHSVIYTYLLHAPPTPTPGTPPTEPSPISVSCFKQQNPSLAFLKELIGRDSWNNRKLEDQDWNADMSREPRRTKARKYSCWLQDSAIAAAGHYCH